VILAYVDPKTTPDWQEDRGRIFRTGYYRRSDGFDCIWLVNERGEYEQSTDRATLLRHFVILKVSDETDFYGDNRAPIRPLNTSKLPASKLPRLLSRS